MKNEKRPSTPRRIMRRLRRGGRAARQTLQAAWTRLSLGVWLLLCPAFAVAAINTDSGEILTDMQDFIRQAGTLLIYVILIGGYATAAYMIINGAVKMIEGREGGLAKFVMGVLVAIVMVMIMTYFLVKSETALEGLN